MIDKRELIRISAWLLVASVAITGCQSCGQKADKPEEEEVKTVLFDLGEVAPDKEGLVLRLEDGTGAPDPSALPHLDRGEPLSEARTRELLSRLPDLNAGEDFDKEYSWPEDEVSRPDDAIRVAARFGEPAEAVEPVRRPLRLVAYSPRGEVESDAPIEVSFSHPVANAGDDGRVRPVPVVFDPPLTGEWKWESARKAVFTPKEGTLPRGMSIDARVEEGLKAQDGAELESDASWSFRFFPERVVKLLPEKPGPNSPLVLVFNAPVDPERVQTLVTIHHKTHNLLFRLAEIEEVRADKDLRNQLRGVPAGHWVALKTVEPMATDAQMTIYFHGGRGLAGGEQIEQWSSYYRTAEAFKAVSGTTPSCFLLQEDDSDEPFDCHWSDTWRFDFNNPVDPDSVTVGDVRIEPPLREARVRVDGAQLIIEGVEGAFGEHSLTLPATLRDIYGQSLTEARTLAFKIITSETFLTSQQGDLLNVDPRGDFVFPMWTAGYSHMRVRIYAADPAATSQADGEGRLQRFVADKLVFEEILEYEVDKDSVSHVQIPLTPANVDRRGHLRVEVASVDPHDAGDELRQRMHRGASLQRRLQYTDIGLDALLVPDSNEIIVWATSLSTHEPLAGVEIFQTRDIDGRAVDGAEVVLTDEQGIARLEIAWQAPPLTTLSRGRTYTPPGRTTHIVGRTNEDAATLAVPAGHGTGLVIRTHRGGGTASVDTSGGSLLWYVVDDRGIYKPGETVHLKGWYRFRPQNEVNALAIPRADSIKYVIRDSRGDKLGSGEADITELGGFDFDLEIPEEADLGEATVEVSANNLRERIVAGGSSHYTHRFRIDEFRRPEFSVNVEADAGLHLVGDMATMTASATYFGGGGLGLSDVRWRVEQKPARFKPPEHDDFSFGRPDGDDTGAQKVGAATHTGTTDATGRHRLHVHFDSVHPAIPMSVTATAAVRDLDNQSWSARKTIVVHPAGLYVGLRTDTQFVRAGDDFSVDLAVTDIKGQRQADHAVVVRAIPLTRRYHGGDWAQGTAQECEKKSHGVEVVRCEFKAGQAQIYRIVAEVTDPAGRRSITETTLRVAGRYHRSASKGHQLTLVPRRTTYTTGETAEILVISPFDSGQGLMTYRVGDEIRTSVFTFENGFHIAELPITDEHSPAIRVRFDIVGSGAPPPGDAARSPIGAASGETRLSVTSGHRTLGIAIEPTTANTRPGEEVGVSVEVRDASGELVDDAEVALWVVDEAILSLTGYALPQPAEVFAPGEPPAIRGVHSRARIALLDDASAVIEEVKNPLIVINRARTVRRPSASLGVESFRGGGQRLSTGTRGGGGVASPEIEIIRGGSHGARRSSAPQAKRSAPRQERRSIELEESMILGTLAAGSDTSIVDALMAGSPGGVLGGEADGDRGLDLLSPVAMREEFRGMVAFEPRLRTDAKGRAQVSLKLPDSVTRYRILAVAAHGSERFGTSESTITAQLPLTVRPSVPRFLNRDDRFQFGVTVQNQSDIAQEIEVAVRAVGLTFGGPGSTGAQGRKINVPAGERREVRFDSGADFDEAFEGGMSRFQIIAMSGDFHDAAAGEIPISQGEIIRMVRVGTVDDQAIAMDLPLPEKLSEARARLGLTTSSTQLDSLGDAMIYLATYPHGCTEQISSRILATTALYDMLEAFEAQGLPDRATMRRSVQADINALVERQYPDGQFGYWTRGGYVNPFASVHAAHAIARARERGFYVPAHVYDRSRTLVSRGVASSVVGHGRGARRVNIVGSHRDTIAAYGFYVANLMGEDVADAALAMARRGNFGTRNIEIAGWLLAVLSEGRQTPEVERVADEMIRQIGDMIEETTDGARIQAPSWSGSHQVFYSRTRVAAVLIDGLMGATPNSSLVAKLVRGLLDARQDGRWTNTQDNAFALVTLRRYFELHEKDVPDFFARAWMGERLAVSHHVEGRVAKGPHSSVPLHGLGDGQMDRRLTLQKEGTGRLYYRLALQLAHPERDLPAEDRGFIVERRYEAVDDIGDVRRRGDGTWVIKAGARVRVRLTMTLTDQRHHVALVDPLPAGLEVLNPELPAQDAVAGAGEPVQRWYEHEDLRDDRVAAFAEALQASTYTYVYMAQATTVGEFSLPRTHAEEMYDPNISGHSATARVIVE